MINYNQHSKLKCCDHQQNHLCYSVCGYHTISWDLSNQGLPARIFKRENCCVQSHYTEERKATDCNKHKFVETLSFSFAKYEPHWVYGRQANGFYNSVWRGACARNASFPYITMAIRPLSTRLIKPNFHIAPSHQRSTIVFLDTRNWMTYVSLSRKRKGWKIRFFKWQCLAQVNSYLNSNFQSGDLMKHWSRGTSKLAPSLLIFVRHFCSCFNDEETTDDTIQLLKA